MMAFPGMLEPACKEAGIDFPTEEELKEYAGKNLTVITQIAEKYPHFHVFCNLQLGRPMKMDGEQFRNAEIIAKVSKEKLKEMTLEDFLALGLEWQQ